MERFPLTVQQKNIWNLQKYYEDTAISNLCGVVFFKEKRDSSFLQQALRRFIQSQSGTRFSEEGELRQYVVNEMNDEILVMSFQAMQEFDAYAEKMAKEPLGLADRETYRFSVFTVDRKSGLLAVLSHLLSDAWTFSLMVNQVDAAYREIVWGGVNGELEEGDYADYIQAGQDYLTSRRYQEDKDYWEEKYRERPERKQRIYVIFTSGSSGMPKGVMIIHKNLYNYLMTVQNTYGIDQFYTSMITNIFVNLSVTVMFLLILTGAVLEIVNKNLVDELQYIIKKKNSLYKLTPTHMDKLIPR